MVGESISQFLIVVMWKTIPLLVWVKLCEIYSMKTFPDCGPSCTEIWDICNSHILSQFKHILTGKDRNPYYDKESSDERDD